MHTVVIYPPPAVTFLGTDRGHLILALVVAVLLHGLLIWQIAFDLDQTFDEPVITTIEVTMVHQSTEEAPDDPDYYAQANQLGGGTTSESVRATSPTSAPFPSPEARLVAMPPPALGGESRADTAQHLTVEAPNRARAKDISPVERSRPTQEQGSAAQDRNDPQRPIADQRVAQTMAVAGLAAERGATFASTSRRRKHEYISANTKSYYAAAYMDAWRRKIERLGNLNYPTAARQEGIYGSLLLEVALVADGSIDEVRVVRSSGHQVLDDAAVRIVRMAAPFSPFPPGIRDKTDVLHITRTWEFRHGDHLTSR